MKQDTTTPEGFDADAATRSERWPALDGMRAFAVLAVMAVHLGDPHLLPGGGLGVDVFFVISGFLITSILIGESDRHGGTRFAAFYMRRALRLFPALAVLLVVVTAAAVVDRGAFWSGPTLTGIPYIVAYVGNWVRAFSNGSLPLGALGQTWSLAVEEQFYLLWPILFVFGVARWRDRRRAALVLAGVALVVMVYRAAALAHGWSIGRVSNGTDTHCDGLLLGCALAAWLSEAGTRTPKRSVSGAAAIAGIVAVGVMMVLRFPPRLLESIGSPVAEVATVAVIWNQVTNPLPVLVRWLTLRPWQWVGKRSYGLYLWHYPIYVILAGGIGVAPRQWPVVIALSFGAAALSYRFVEQPFLRRKARFQMASAVQGIEQRDPPSFIPAQ